jgi:hypothetical protein
MRTFLWNVHMIVGSGNARAVSRHNFPYGPRSMLLVSWEISDSASEMPEPSSSPPTTTIVQARSYVVGVGKKVEAILDLSNDALFSLGPE